MPDPYREACDAVRGILHVFKAVDNDHFIGEVDKQNIYEEHFELIHPLENHAFHQTLEVLHI